MSVLQKSPGGGRGRKVSVGGAKSVGERPKNLGRGLQRITQQFPNTQIEWLVLRDSCDSHRRKALTKFSWRLEAGS